MKRWLVIAVSIIILGIIGGILGYKYVYNKPHRNYEKATPDYMVSSEELFIEYNDSKAEAEKKYNGKVLEISGILSAIENPDSLSILVFALRQGMFGDEGIRCTLLPKYNEQANALTLGNRIAIKGYCAGYNDIDIILEKCSILQ